MSSERRIRDLLRSEPVPAGAQLGWPTKAFVNVDSVNERMTFAGNVFGKERNKLRGDVKVDDASSVKYSLGGGLTQFNAPTGGLIPSTLFTPFPRDALGIDMEYMELLHLMASVRSFAGGLPLA